MARRPGTSWPPSLLGEAQSPRDPVAWFSCSRRRALGGTDVQAGSSLVWPCVRPGPPIPRTGHERSSAPSLSALDLPAWPAPERHSRWPTQPLTVGYTSRPPTGRGRARVTQDKSLRPQSPETVYVCCLSRGWGPGHSQPCAGQTCLPLGHRVGGPGLGLPLSPPW